MCGIAGLVGDSSRDSALLSRMAGAIAHRGPDDQGIWIDVESGVGLANRRLAIIDLSPHGHQPMHSSNGRYVLTVNGEIYNHAEIREERGAQGRIQDFFETGRVEIDGDAHERVEIAQGWFAPLR